MVIFQDSVFLSSRVKVFILNFASPLENRCSNLKAQKWILSLVFCLGGVNFTCQKVIKELLVSEKWQDIIQLVEVPQMLEKQPALRIGHHVKTDIAFLEHPYFSEIDWDSAHLQNDNGPPILWKCNCLCPCLCLSVCVCLSLSFSLSLSHTHSLAFALSLAFSLFPS